MEECLERRQKFFFFYMDYLGMAKVDRVASRSQSGFGAIWALVQI